MDTLKKNRKVAVLCLILAIILCIPLGTYRSLSSIERKVEKEYTAKDKYGETVKGTTDMLSYHLTEFADEYEKALGESENSMLIRKSAEALGDSAVSDEGFHVDTVKAAVMSMHGELDKLDVYPDGAKSAYVKIDSDISILKKYESYNNAANDYNSAAQSFMGKLLGFGFAAEF